MPDPDPKPLAIEQFAADARIDAAKFGILSALSEHQKNLTTIRSPDPARKIPYDALLKSFGESRGGNLYFPYLASGFGHGPFVELADGSVKFDFISGIGVHHFGHSNPALILSSIDAAIRDTVMQGNLQQNTESADLAALLIKRTGPNTKLAHCFFTSSGAMANENALKLAFHKKATASGSPGASRILAFHHAFAGRSMALSTITDKAAYRVGVPPALPVDYLPFFDATAPEKSTAATLAALNEITARYPGQHAALWCEFIQGEGGFYAGSPEFFTALFEALHAKNILIVADEVQTFGRTSHLFAFQHFNVAQFIDIATIGKMLQLCATLFTDGLKPAPGLLSQTFTASTSAIFAARTILTELLGENLFGQNGRNLQVNARFVRNFQQINSRHPNWIKGPHGTGAMIALTPLDGSEKTIKTILTNLFNNGVIAFYNGSNPARIRFLPPVPILTDTHIDEVCKILENSLEQTASAT